MSELLDTLQIGELFLGKSGKKLVHGFEERLGKPLNNKSKTAKQYKLKTKPLKEMIKTMRREISAEFENLAEREDGLRR